MRKNWMTASLILAGLVMMVGSNLVTTAAEKPGKVLRHLVMYKFREDLTPAQLQEVIDTFLSLEKSVDEVVSIEHGVNVSPEGKSEGLTHAFLVTFKDEKGRDAYLVHPAHQRYVDVAKNRREKVVVFDYWTAE